MPQVRKAPIVFLLEFVLLYSPMTFGSDSIQTLTGLCVSVFPTTLQVLEILFIPTILFVHFSALQISTYIIITNLVYVKTSGL